MLFLEAQKKAGLNKSGFVRKLIVLKEDVQSLKFYLDLR
jgi:hypothetical protein